MRTKIPSSILVHDLHAIEKKLQYNCCFSETECQEQVNYGTFLISGSNR